MTGFGFSHFCGAHGTSGKCSKLHSGGVFPKECGNPLSRPPEGANLHTRFGEEDRIGNALFSLVPTNILKVKELRDLADKHPVNLLECFQQADPDQFPNVEQLLRIGCTLPVGSAEAERTFSAFRRLKTYLRSKMSEERLSGLVLMHIHIGIHIDVKEICHKYIQAHERRMFQGCIIKQTLMEDKSV